MAIMLVIGFIIALFVLPPILCYWWIKRRFNMRFTTAIVVFIVCSILVGLNTKSWKTKKIFGWPIKIYVYSENWEDTDGGAETALELYLGIPANIAIFFDLSSLTAVLCELYFNREKRGRENGDCPRQDENHPPAQRDAPPPK